MSRFIVVLSVALSIFLAPPVSGQPDQAVLIEFLEALDKPLPERREYVSTRMTQRLVEELGLDTLVETLQVLSDELGDFRVTGLQIHPARIEADVDLVSTGGRIILTLPVGPAPEYRVDGILIAPRPPDFADLPPVTDENVTDVLSQFMAGQELSGFSGSVLVAQRDRILYAGAFGPADPEGLEFNTMLTAFNLGPLTEMYTSVLIHKLAEEGKLGLPSTIGEYLPDWPNETLRTSAVIGHLLAHTSGLPSIPGEARERVRGRLATPADHAGLFDRLPLRNDPGEAVHFSEANPVVLALIAEKVTGQDYLSLIEQYIYRPSGMQGSGHFTPADVEACCAIGIMADGSANTALLPRRGSPAGGSYSTAVDLWRFSQALLQGRLLGAQAFYDATRVVALIGPEVGMGLGFNVFGDGDEIFLGASGRGPGIGVDYALYPASGHIVIVLSNIDNGARPVAVQLRQLIRPLIADPDAASPGE